MLQLPSGRHVAVSNRRLLAEAERYRETGEPASIGRIAHIEDLKPWLDILYFRPDSGYAFEPSASSPVPEGVEPYPSGLTLASLERGEGDWPDEDRRALAEQLTEGILQEWLQRTLDHVSSCRLEHESPHARKLATALVDTLEDERAEGGNISQILSFSDPRRVQTFAVAAILRLLSMCRSNETFYRRHFHRLDRLRAFLELLFQQEETFKQWLTQTNLPADALAARMWEAGWLDALPALTREWLERQLPHEIANMWPALDNDEAEALFRTEYEIIQAAWLSPYVTTAIERR